MRDAPSRRSGDGAPEHLPPPPGPPPAPGPPIPPRPTTPDAPGATRADRHGRPPRPNALNDPPHHTRETHPDASATTLWTRRTRPSRPSPRPSRPTPSKPPLNNLHGSAGLPRTPGTAGQESHGATGGTMPKDSPAMGRVGPGGARSGAPPRGLTRNGAGGAPGTVLRWGLVQICCKGAPGRDRPREEARNTNVSSRTLRRDPGLCNRFGQPAPPGPSPGTAAGWAAAVTNTPAIPRATTPARPTPSDAPGAQTCTSHSKVQFQPLFSSAKCTSRRGGRRRWPTPPPRPFW